MFVLKKPYGLNTRMVQLVLDRMVGPYEHTHTVRTVRAYAYGPDCTRTVQIRVWSGTYTFIIVSIVFSMIHSLFIY